MKTLIGSDSCVEAVETPALAPVGGDELTHARLRMERAGFHMDGNTTEALKAYLEGRSLLLGGKVGTGKTFFFRMLGAAGLAKNDLVVYSIKQHDNDGIDSIVRDMRNLRDCEVVLDDIGSEHDKVDFGDRPDLLASIIAQREASPKRTHYTTNLTADMLKKRYGERVTSRLRLCESVPFVGKDRRRPAANPQEAAFRAACEDPENWKICAERCSRFIAGRCANGVLVPPAVRKRSPENSCGVGCKIPYADGYLEDVRREREARHARARALGIRT